MSQYAHPETLVDTQWLSEHLDDPNIRIIEMALDSQLYDDGHIPGAIFWNFTTPLLPDFRTNFDITAIEKLLGSFGISNDNIVVLVHRDTPSSGWIFWLFKVFGHADVRILNGGSQKWLEDGYPLTTEKKVVTPTDYHVNTLDESLRALSQEVQDSIEKSDRILLDVRMPQEYHGELYLLEPPKENERAGHIPGAINLYYELAHNDDGTFKTCSELQKIYQEKGITPDKTIIPYCAVGGRSGHTWFILKYLLGYPQVKNYDGSWNEWSRLPNSPIEK
ncbi:Thiosulfate sulfurtransferase [Hyella patelloides LEGE 07179]|uniref:Sulfurtransferase n=1 Tax=Hyella patelloides LEGE 07179 TaxID=945734 RepID=A0A563VM06_9CYAN|nr:sulfurtransferase [Hyella patelloides]VEP12448.1 Thiosulfate sulfurtransferase [Hyella patelloides LEGE 07179]